MTPTLSDQIGQAASLVGLLLALVTLFTSEQSSRLSDEREREGGARAARVRSIRLICCGLGLVTTTSLVLLGPLVVDVTRAVGETEWEPVFGVFLLVYLLLGALLCWQGSLAVRARR